MVPHFTKYICFIAFLSIAPAFAEEAAAPAPVSAPAAAEPATPSGIAGEIYTGPNNEWMEIAYPAEDGNRALIRISGVNHEWDGKIKPVTIRPGIEGGTDFTLVYEGIELVVLTKRKSYDSDIVVAHLPGYEQDILLTYSKDASEKFQPQHLKTTFDQEVAVEQKAALAARTR